MSDEVRIPLPRSLQEIVGSLLFASETPLTANELRAAVREVEPEEGDNAEIMDVYRTCTAKEIDEAIRGLEKALEVGGTGFKLVCTAGAYRLQTAPRGEIIVTFLAVLELLRQHRIIVYQNAAFHEITILPSKERPDDAPLEMPDDYE